MVHLLTTTRRKLLTLSMLLAMLVGGVNSAWAQETTEGFEDWDASVGDGWLLINSATYGNSYSYDYVVGSSDFTPASGSNCLANSSHSAAQGTTSSPMIVTPAMTGTLTFKFRKYNSSSSTKGYINVFEYDESTSAAIGSSIWTCRPNYTNEATSTYQTATISVGDTPKRYAIYLAKVSVDDFTYTPYSQTSGPALVVKDGSKITSPYSFDFGLATAGTTHTFTLSNPGTAAVEGLSVSETGNFGATLSATSIAAGGEATLTVTMPEATAKSTITISSTTEGINDFVIIVSGTVKDPNKMFVDFADNVLPEDWESAASSTYYSWNFASGYAAYSGSSSSYSGTLKSPKLTFTAGEKFFFNTSRYGSSTWYSPSISIQTSTDGNTWKTVQTYTDDEYGVWKTRSVEIASADVKYIRFSGWYINIDNIYGGELPQEPKMVVTQPASLDFGVITEATPKTFTIANTGRAVLEGINVTSSNSSIFAVSGAPTSLEAGESAEVTITMAATTTGALSSDITVSATAMNDVEFTVTGVVLPEGMFVVDFNDNQLPAGWTNASWTIADGAATGKSSSAYLTTPKLTFEDGDLIVIKAKRADSDATDYITIQGSSDNGSTWTAYSKKISGSDGLAYPDYGTLVISDIPSTVNKLRFVGYYVVVDEIAGLTYAPVLSVTKDGEAVSTPATYDFGECAADATVTYNFVNSGAGTINITNVAITGDGAAAYKTNWTESVATPFELTITRAYDATRTDAQAAVVTVTTTEGSFVINVTGTDKAANAPELAVDVTALDFGKLTADDTKTVTVTNEGTGLLTVNIASDSEDFQVSPATLEGIAAGESKTFTVTFKYTTGNYGSKTANITVTPTYDETAAVTIAATAIAKDPAVWSEDFSESTLPVGWEAGTNWSIEDGVAKGSYAYNTTNYLTTPKLRVNSTTDKLTFDYKATANYVSVKIQMAQDAADFADYNTISELNNGDAGTYTITGLQPGEYRFRFASDNYELDNFEGFKLIVNDHDAEVKEYNIPAAGNQYVEYTASITVKVTGTSGEELTAKFYIGDNQYGDAVTKTVAADATETFTVTFAPEEAISGEAKFIVENTNVSLKTVTVAVEIAAATMLDEMVGLPNGLTTGTKPSLVFKYTPKSGWNTIATPFALTNDILTAIFGEGYKAFQLNSYDGTYIDFEPSNSFYAGYPYLVYVETAPTAPSEGFKLFDVNVSTTSANYDLRNGATFQATYAPIAAGSMTDTWYGITTDGEIRKAGSGASLRGFRAYITGISGTAPSLSISGDDDATGINGLQLSQGENAVVYDLNGRRVKTPTKGLYIINGKKVMVN